MEGKVMQLRGLIYGEFNSESDFARRLGWSRQKLNKITNGVKEPDITELNEMSKLLNKTVGDLAQIFLERKSPNRQQSNSA
jgi:transcriptional regulator with XRE-family HTH domain